MERPAERPVATIEQVYAIADAIEPRYRAMVLLATFCGLRVGELRALRQVNLDLLHRSVSVVEQYQQLGDGTLVLGPPKTDAGVRNVSIPAVIVPDLELHLAAWTSAGPAHLVFPGESGRPFRTATLHAAWHRALRAVGISGLRFHDLRHTGNTLAAATGNEHEGADVANGPRLSSGRAHLPARHARPGRGDRRPTQQSCRRPPPANLVAAASAKLRCHAAAVLSWSQAGREGTWIHSASGLMRRRPALVRFGLNLQYTTACQGAVLLLCAHRRSPRDRVGGSRPRGCRWHRRRAVRGGSVNRREIVGFAAVACVACCIGPIIGVVGAIAALGVVSTVLIGVAGLVIAVAALVAIMFLRRRHARACVTPPEPVAVEFTRSRS